MKRKRSGRLEEHAAKRTKLDKDSELHPTAPLLRQYYPQVVTLRHYLASRLSNFSKKRRKKLLQYGSSDRNEHGAAVAELLDSTLVGTFNRVNAEEFELETIEKDISAFTQQLTESANEISLTQGALKQSEVGVVLS
jgi:telomerase reverse transcriptase